jgi:glycosyltransferase involved in cell wall biosynthesis
MDSKLVSVIIPAFNAEKYIYQCVMSVLCQTYTNIEVIVVNDGSNDATWEILNQIIDTRLVLINQENNGCSSAKNSGLRMSKGDFIQYLDSDDMLSPDKLKNQVLALLDNEDAIAVCKTCVFQTDLDEVVGEIDTELIRKEGTGFEFLLRLLGSEGFSGMVQPNAYLISRKIADMMGEWNVILSPSPDEDGEYFARALCIAEKVIFTEGVNYYRKLPLQTSLSNLYSFQRVTNL